MCSVLCFISFLPYWRINVCICQQVLRPQVQVKVQVPKPPVRVQVLRPQVQVLQTCTRVQLEYKYKYQVRHVLYITLWPKGCEVNLYNTSLSKPHSASYITTLEKCDFNKYPEAS